MTYNVRLKATFHIRQDLYPLENPFLQESSIVDLEYYLAAVAYTSKGYCPTLELTRARGWLYPIIIRSESADAHTPRRAVFEPGAQTSLDVWALILIRDTCVVSYFASQPKINKTLNDIQNVPCPACVSLRS